MTMATRINVMRIRSASVVASIVASIVLVGCGFFAGESPEAVVPASAEAIALESTAFEANGAIPSTYTCDGDDSSPALSWGVLPANTQSMVLIMDDPDAPRGRFVHWVVYDIPPDVAGFAEGIPDGESLAVGGLHGKNGFRQVGYGGPCPPSGTHRYVFRLYALDTILELPSGKSKGDVVEAMNGHIVGVGELIGQYARE
ncbi:MAG: YbhB/YbcL family Raf kinase inhibitor-like protein [Cyanobacteria bacterium P01_E01_bin.6]